MNSQEVKRDSEFPHSGLLSLFNYYDGCLEGLVRAGKARNKAIHLQLSPFR